MSSLLVFLLIVALSALAGAVPLALAARRSPDVGAPSTRRPTPSPLPIAPMHERRWWAALALCGPALWLLWAAAAPCRADVAISAGVLLMILLVAALMLPQEGN